MLSLIFDIDDTLYARITPFLQAIQKTFGNESAGLAVDDYLLFKQFIKRGNEVFEDSMTGAMSMENMWVYRIQRSLEDFGIPVTREKALEFQTAYDWFQHHIKPSAVITKLLDQCKEKGIFLGVITNGKSGHQRMKYNALELGRWIPEENLLITEDIGVNKPDPAVFRAAEKQMHLDLDETWYIGDSYEHDIVGAYAAGWHVIWLDRHRKIESMTECVADHVVHTEEELQKCIEQILIVQ